MNRYTFDYFRDMLEFALHAGYEMMGCLDYFKAKSREELGSHTLVLRHDMDRGVWRAKQMAEIESELGVRGTYFVRLHCPQYNAASFDGFVAIRAIAELGHELGLHDETLDFAAVSGEPPELVLERDIGILESLFGVDVRGAAPHRDWSGCNNLDLWETHDPSDFGLDYVAYATLGLFAEALFVSQHGTGWKCYDSGYLTGYTSDLLGHLRIGAKEKKSTICALIHPALWHSGLYHVRGML